MKVKFPVVVRILVATGAHWFKGGKICVSQVEGKYSARVRAAAIGRRSIQHVAG